MNTRKILEKTQKEIAKFVGIIDREAVICYSCKKSLYLFEVFEQYSFNYGEVVISVCSKQCKMRFFNHLISEITEKFASHTPQKPTVIYQKDSPQFKYVAVKVI